jgi:hypothetical protein
MMNCLLCGTLVVLSLAFACAAVAGKDAQQTSALWGVDCLTKVLRDATPSPQQGDVHLEGARGETVSGQAVFRPAQPAADARASVSDLKSESGVLPAGKVRLQWVRYIAVKRNSGGVPPDELVAKAPCDLPDPFWDTPAVSVPANTAQPLWIEVDVPRDALQGHYAGTLTLKWRNGEASLPMTLTVWDFEMPVERHQHVTNWFTFPGAGYRVAEDSDAWWNLARRFARMMAAHRQDCFRADLGWIKTTYEPQTGFRCDFRYLDRWAETFFAEGLQRMELFQAGTCSGPQYEPGARISPADLPVEVRAEGVKLTPEQKLRGVLEQLEKHVRQKGWTGRVMLHIFDEPFIYCEPSYRQVAGIVHRAAPSLKVIEAVETTGFGDAIDVLVPKLSHLNLWYPHFRQAQERGKELWFYTCCHPTGRYPNRFLDQPLVKTRVLHWLGYLYGLDGYLHWGLNYFAEGCDPYSEDGISKDLPLGDRAIMYPGKDGPVGSLRWSAMRDGLQDYEYLWTLERRLADLKRRRGEGAVWLDPRQRPLEICRRVVTSFYDHTRNASVLLEARRAIAEEIESLERGPLLYVQTEPAEGTAIPSGPRLINIRGLAAPGAEVTVNGQKVKTVQEDGAFMVAWFPDTPAVTIKAVKDGRSCETMRTFRLVE